MTLVITPATRIGELLDEYPAMEAVLTEMSPAFAKLRNPILRQTVAKVATVEQAARIGGVNLNEMVGRLRSAAGLEAVAAPEPGLSPENMRVPGWLQDDAVTLTIDADRMLETGEHPIGKVRQWAAAATPGDMLRLDSSFRPEPLIQLFSRQGMLLYSAEVSPGRHSTYFRRAV